MILFVFSIFEFVETIHLLYDHGYSYFDISQYVNMSSQCSSFLVFVWLLFDFTYFQCSSHNTFFLRAALESIVRGNQAIVYSYPLKSLQKHNHGTVRR